LRQQSQPVDPFEVTAVVRQHGEIVAKGGRADQVLLGVPRAGPDQASELPDLLEADDRRQRFAAVQRGDVPLIAAGTPGDRG
jgi:hypothetical protein